MSVRLNLGSGSLPLDGFVNIDALPDAPGVDLVADISEPLPFDDGAVDLIYAVHLLEHFATDEVPGLLADWRRVLREGGKVLIAVPDLDLVARTLIDREGWFTPPHSPWVGAIYGGQKDQYDFHKTGFTAPWLAWLLDQAGFGDVQRVDRFEDVAVNDASYSPLPFGRNCSLNMTGTVGGARLPASDLAGRRIERAFDAVDRPLSYALTVSTSLRARAMARRRRRLERSLRSPGRT